MANLEKYKGVIPAFYACYDAEGNVSPERVRACLLYTSILGLAAAGAAGEYGIARYFFHRTVVRGNAKRDRTRKLSLIHI